MIDPKQNIQDFGEKNIFDAITEIMNCFEIPMQSISRHPLQLTEFFSSESKQIEKIQSLYAVGLVDQKVFSKQTSYSDIESLRKLDKYEALGIFGAELNDPNPSRSLLADLTRLINREMKAFPVIVIFKYNNKITFANTERLDYKQPSREGEKTGKVTMLKDINISQPHSAHLRILSGLCIKDQDIDTFSKLYSFWHRQFSIQALNSQFYEDLQEWFYYASQNISLPYKPDYIKEKENIKNFLVRLLARTMFCWFLKEKKLIRHEMLDLVDWGGRRYKLTSDIESDKFLHSNSYYRGILQNIFFNSLNQLDKKTLKSFKWIKYLNKDFDPEWFISIPYLNAGIFDQLEEDNAKESIEDSVIKIPNYLFYGIVEENESNGKNGKINRVEHKGLNGILRSYKFTLDENTPFEEDIALDPELLGLVFENLLAELDPNLEESTIKSIRKQTGSYYTPRKVILEMVNDSLYLYISKYFYANCPDVKECKKLVSDLIYKHVSCISNEKFCRAVVQAIDKFRMLDPACGSGAFPMGMLHRIVEILKLTDPDNKLWLDLKLKNVDVDHREEFKQILTKHLDDYGRKLGIIKDSIYGIDIQPLAVQITKLRFFISLLIDQDPEKGITPMPNIETKIICADSLKNLQTDLFSKDAIDNLIASRAKYYQPDINKAERESLTKEIVEVLDRAFPDFAKQITGRNISGQNKVLLKEWFLHGTIAAPFFNLDFFYPELKSTGFDCVIGNPPYGGFKVSEEVRQSLGIESKDPYGAFIGCFLNDYDKPTPLKHGGVLAFIVSDTFMTIKSHLPLRRKLMQNYIHKMLRVHPDTFRATVNTVIFVAERNTLKDIDSKHVCLMADMTNISINDDYELFISLLNLTRGVDFSEKCKNLITEKFAIYFYPQTIIKNSTNLPFFVASPKLFKLLNDNEKTNKKSIVNIVNTKVSVRAIELNGKNIQIVKFGDIADVRKGIDTGNNHLFLFQNPNARGNYRDINEFLDFVITEEELIEISNNAILREMIKFQGFSLNSSKKNFYKGKFIIPYEKGGEGNIDSGWLPNYYVPNAYFIDWSESSVSAIKKAQENEKNQSTLRNQDYWFKAGLTFSLTGFYAPTVRTKSPSMFDNKSSGIFTQYNEKVVLCIMISKIKRYLMKNYLMHTVDTQVGVFDDSVFVINSECESKLIEYASSIIKNQKKNSLYDYASNEQIEIDKLVYEAYGLNAEDILEVENWYTRRYPKLSAAQKANLRALGKSDDYLVLYGLK